MGLFMLVLRSLMRCTSFITLRYAGGAVSDVRYCWAHPAAYCVCSRSLMFARAGFVRARVRRKLTLTAIRNRCLMMTSLFIDYRRMA